MNKKARTVEQGRVPTTREGSDNETLSYMHDEHKATCCGTMGCWLPQAERDSRATSRGRRVSLRGVRCGALARETIPRCATGIGERPGRDPQQRQGGFQGRDAHGRSARRARPDAQPGHRRRRAAPQRAGVHPARHPLPGARHAGHGNAPLGERDPPDPDWRGDHRRGTVASPLRRSPPRFISRSPRLKELGT